MLLKKLKNKTGLYLLLSFLIGLLPTLFVIHIIPVDFSGYYFEATSFLKHHGYAYQILTNHCGNPINSGLNARAPLVPLLMSISFWVFGQNLLGLYVPFFLARIALVPLTFLAASQYVSKHIAFLVSLLVIFIPKLQTYSLGAFEADIFVAVFATLALYWYGKSNRLHIAKYAIGTALALGLASLAKATGFAIAIGFFVAVFFQNMSILIQKRTRRNFLLMIIYFLIVFGPYILWTISAHNQIYISTQHDKSLLYIAANLPSLLYTIPLYLGLVFGTSLKATIISYVFLIIFGIGIIFSLYKRQFVLIVPTLVTLILIATLETCLMGTNIPYNYEFVTILSFAMIPTSILFFVGVETLASVGIQKLLHMKKRIYIISVTLLSLLLMYKFINNFRSNPYTLDYIPDEYYISIPTIIKNKELLPEVEFTMQNGLRIFQRPKIHAVIREQFKQYQFNPFSKIYLYPLFILTGIGLCTVLIDGLKNNREQ